MHARARACTPGLSSEINYAARRPDVSLITEGVNVGGHARARACACSQENNMKDWIAHGAPGGQEPCTRPGAQEGPSSDSDSYVDHSSVFWPLLPVLPLTLGDLPGFLGGLHPEYPGITGNNGNKEA